MAGAVSRDGALASLHLTVPTGGNDTQSVFTNTFKGVENLAGIDGGVIFDAKRDVLYGVNSVTNQVIAFDTNTWVEKYRVTIDLTAGEDVLPFDQFGNGVMATSGDGRFLFLSTNKGVQRIDLPQPSPLPAALFWGERTVS